MACRAVRLPPWAGWHVDAVSRELAVAAHAYGIRPGCAIERAASRPLPFRFLSPTQEEPT
jgi:hypothetical protein